MEGLLSSRRQVESWTEAFMELSENMSREVEMVPRVNSANFSWSSCESNSCTYVTSYTLCLGCASRVRRLKLGLSLFVWIWLMLCVCVCVTIFSLGLYRTSVIESNVKFNLSVVFSLMFFWGSTTAAVTTVWPADLSQQNAPSATIRVTGLENVVKKQAIAITSENTAGKHQVPPVYWKQGQNSQ